MATPPDIAVIGGGPAGLMAAETLARAGARVTVFEAMPGGGRKFLMAGRGGLNLTHSEPFDRVLSRYGRAADNLAPALRAFPPEALRRWSEGLGQPTFVGSSGRVFPIAMKASPLLRAWLARLAGLEVRFVLRARWTGWDAGGALTFAGAGPVRPQATVLALGGASWPRLGGDGGWVPALRARGVDVAPFKPSNCGFAVDWSAHFRERFAGAPLKRIALRFGDHQVRGEAVVTATGLEGGAVYALSGPLRDALEAGDGVVLRLDLRPDMALPDLQKRLASGRGSQSVATFLRKAAGLAPVGIGLLRETGLPASSAALAAAIKAVPLRLRAPAPLARAISSAGGIPFSALDGNLMLRAIPGVFAAGEMLDWEAPTGGYLLQACFATGVAAARGALGWLGIPAGNAREAP